jgi:flagellar basal-body rod protein FlgF
VRIDSGGRIWIVPAGGDPAQPQEIDRVKIASPVGSRIVKALDGLFRVEGGGALPADPTANVRSRSLEGSNVDATKSLVELIEASRAWDAQLKLISAAREVDTSAADLMRLPD